MKPTVDTPRILRCVFISMLFWQTFSPLRGTEVIATSYAGYVWRESYSLKERNRGAILFEVAKTADPMTSAPNDIYVGFNDKATDAAGMFKYEILFGGFNNTKSIIHTNSSALVVSENSVARIPFGEKRFWCSFDNGTIAIGVGGSESIGRSPIMSWTDPNWATNGATANIQYFSVKAGDTGLTYKNIASVALPPTSSAGAASALPAFSGPSVTATHGTQFSFLPNKELGVADPLPATWALSFETEGEGDITFDFRQSGSSSLIAATLMFFSPNGASLRLKKTDGMKERTNFTIDNGNWNAMKMPNSDQVQLMFSGAPLLCFRKERSAYWFSFDGKILGFGQGTNIGQNIGIAWQVFDTPQQLDLVRLTPGRNDLKIQNIQQASTSQQATLFSLVAAEWNTLNQKVNGTADALAIRQQEQEEMMSKINPLFSHTANENKADKKAAIQRMIATLNSDIAAATNPGVIAYKKDHLQMLERELFNYGLDSLSDAEIASRLANARTAYEAARAQPESPTKANDMAYQNGLINTFTTEQFERFKKWVTTATDDQLGAKYTEMNGNTQYQPVIYNEQLGRLTKWIPNASDADLTAKLIVVANTAEFKKMVQTEIDTRTRKNAIATLQTWLPTASEADLAAKVTAIQKDAKYTPAIASELVQLISVEQQKRSAKASTLRSMQYWVEQISVTENDLKARLSSVENDPILKSDAIELKKIIQDELDKRVKYTTLRTWILTASDAELTARLAAADTDANGKRFIQTEQKLRTDFREWFPLARDGELVKALTTAQDSVKPLIKAEILRRLAAWATIASDADLTTKLADSSVDESGKTAIKKEIDDRKNLVTWLITASDADLATKLTAVAALAKQKELVQAEITLRGDLKKWLITASEADLTNKLTSVALFAKQKELVQAEITLRGDLRKWLATATDADIAAKLTAVDAFIKQKELVQIEMTVREDLKRWLAAATDGDVRSRLVSVALLPKQKEMVQAEIDRRTTAKAATSAPTPAAASTQPTSGAPANVTPTTSAPAASQPGAATLAPTPASTSPQPVGGTPVNVTPVTSTSGTPQPGAVGATTAASLADEISKLRTLDELALASKAVGASPELAQAISLEITRRTTSPNSTPPASTTAPTPASLGREATSTVVNTDTATYNRTYTPTRRR